MAQHLGSSGSKVFGDEDWSRKILNCEKRKETDQLVAAYRKQFDKKVEEDLNDLEATLPQIREYHSNQAFECSKSELLAKVKKSQVKCLRKKLKIAHRNRMKQFDRNKQEAERHFKEIQDFMARNSCTPDVIQKRKLEKQNQISTARIRLNQLRIEIENLPDLISEVEDLENQLATIRKSLEEFKSGRLADLRRKLDCLKLRMHSEEEYEEGEVDGEGMEVEDLEENQAWFFPELGELYDELGALEKQIEEEGLEEYFEENWREKIWEEIGPEPGN